MVPIVRFFRKKFPQPKKDGRPKKEKERAVDRETEKATAKGQENKKRNSIS